MKNIILNIISIMIILFGQTVAFAQTETQKSQTETSENQTFTYGEFRAGYGVTMFGTGLKERYEAGNFSSSGGGLFTLAAYHKLKAINYLTFGIKFKALGAGPSKGNNNEEMFFNYWGAAVTAKYFPFDKNARKGLYLQTDFFFITQFTQKYRIIASNIYDHQFALGNGFAFGIGYDFPIKNRKTMLTVGLEYETDSRTGEVGGIGKKTFQSSNFGIMAGIKF